MLFHDDDDVDMFGRGFNMSMDSFTNTAPCLDSSQWAPTPQVRGLCECACVRACVRACVWHCVCGTVGEWRDR